MQQTASPSVFPSRHFCIAFGISEEQETPHMQLIVHQGAQHFAPGEQKIS
jgi:hypothetical protein